MGEYARIAQNFGDLADENPAVLKNAIPKLGDQIEAEVSSLFGLLRDLNANHRGSESGSLPSAHSSISCINQKLLKYEDLLQKYYYLSRDFSSSLNILAHDPFYIAQTNNLRSFKKDISNATDALEAVQKKAALFSETPKDIYTQDAGVDSYYYQAERNRLENTDKLVDDILEQAYTAQYAITEQGTYLSSMHKRINGIAAQFPVVDRLLRKIWRGKRSDTIILGLVIGLCLIILFFRIIF